MSLFEFYPPPKSKAAEYKNIFDNWFAAVETKYDGNRAQIHKNTDTLCVFSKTGKPLNYDVSEYLSYFNQAFPNYFNFIFDAELIAVNTITGLILPFEELSKKNLKAQKHLCLCFKIFDCLYYNDICMINKTLSERKDVIKKINPIQYKIELVDTYPELENCKVTKDTFCKAMKKVIDNKLEGLMFKLDSNYDSLVYKIKTEYLLGNNLIDSVDLVILGARYGTGKFKNVFSILILGVMDEATKKFKTVTKIKGGSDANILALQPYINKNFKFVNKLKIEFPKTCMPDVYLTTEKYKVFEIGGNKISKSPEHTSKYSIRFPKILREKKYFEMPTLSKLVEIYNADSSDEIYNGIKAQVAEHVK